MDKFVLNSIKKMTRGQILLHKILKFNFVINMAKKI